MCGDILSFRSICMFACFRQNVFYYWTNETVVILYFTIVTDVYIIEYYELTKLIFFKSLCLNKTDVRNY